jgi:hypothetical protein
VGTRLIRVEGKEPIRETRSNLRLIEDSTAVVIAARIRRLNRELDKRARRIFGTSFDPTDKKEIDIHPPFVKCPIDGCYFTYHEYCKHPTLERHLKEEHSSSVYPFYHK